MIDNQFHNDPTLCNDPENLNYNFDHVSPYMSMNELNKLKYNLNTLSVLQLNGRSIVKNFDNLKLLLKSIHNTFDVISICETWFNEFNMNLFELQGYTSFHTIRNHKKAGGVSIYIKSSFSTNKIVILSLSNLYIDTITIEIKLDTRNIIISSIYRSPSLEKDSFVYLNNCIEKFNVYNGKHIFLCGDFNIDILKANTITDYFLNTLQLQNLFKSINQPTRISNNSSTLIDNIFYNGNFSYISSGILQYEFTDHLPIFILMKLNKIRFKCKQNVPIITHNINNTNNVNKLMKELNETNWTFIKSEDINISLDLFITHFSKIYDKTCLKKHKSNNIFRKKDIPWFTKSLKKACRKKQKLYIKYINNRNDNNLRIYKKYKNDLTNIIRKCKKDFYTKSLDNSKSIKTTWSIINSLINPIQKKNTKISVLDIHGKEIKDETIANKCNEHFIQVGSKLAKNICSPNTSFNDYLKNSNYYSLFLSPITCSEVIKTIDNFSPKISKDELDISMKLVKLISSTMAEPLTYIFNLSFSTGTFPNVFKKSKVIPIYKSGNKNDFNNYRPICLNIQFSKILEKLFFFKITFFL